MGFYERLGFKQPAGSRIIWNQDPWVEGIGMVFGAPHIDFEEKSSELYRHHRNKGAIGREEDMSSECI